MFKLEGIDRGMGRRRWGRNERKRGGGEEGRRGGGEEIYLSVEAEVGEGRR